MLSYTEHNRNDADQTEQDADLPWLVVKDAAGAFHVHHNTPYNRAAIAATMQLSTEGLEWALDEHGIAATTDQECWVADSEDLQSAMEHTKPKDGIDPSNFELLDDICCITTDITKELGGSETADLTDGERAALLLVTEVLNSTLQRLLGTNR